MTLTSVVDRNTLDKFATQERKLIRVVQANEEVRNSDYTEFGLNWARVDGDFTGKAGNHKAGMFDDRNRIFLRLVEAT